MTAMLGLIQFGLIGFIAIFEYKNRSSSVFMWATLMLMFGITHLLTCFSGTDYSRETINRASLFVIAFCIVYFLSRVVIRIDRANGHRAVFDEIKSKKRNHRIGPLLFVIVVLLMVFSTARSQGGLLNTSWGGERTYMASRSYVSADNLTGFLYAALAGVPFVCILNKEKKNFIICILANLALLLVTRNRVLMLPAATSIIAFFIYKTRARISMKAIIAAALGSVLVVYMVYAIRAFRWMGSLQSAFSNFRWETINSTVRMFLENEDGELGLRKFFYLFLEENNDFEGFNRMATYLRMLFIFIPTKFSLGLKPRDFAETMALAVGGSVGGSIHPTLFGDCYANANFLGVFLGGLWGLIVSVCDKVIGKMKNINLKRMAYITCAYGYVVISRGAVYSGAVVIAWGIFIIYLTSLLETKVTLKST